MLGILSVKQLMPELCRFDGFGVYIYPGDHDPPHFHARRADFRVKVDISTIAVTKGWMPSSVERRLLAWVELHQTELIEAWDRVKEGQVPDRITPPRGRQVVKADAFRPAVVQPGLRNSIER